MVLVIYDILHAEFMEYSGHIYIGKIVFIYLNRLTTIIKYLEGCKISNSKYQVFFLHQKQNFRTFLILLV